MEPFAIGHHVCKGKWTSFAGEKLDTAMQLNDVKDKYAVAIFQEGKSLVIFPLESLESLQRLFFIFSKQLKKTDGKESLMVKLSIRMMAWGWKCHLDCYLQQKKLMDILKERLPNVL